MAIGEEHLTVIEKTIQMIEKYGLYKIIKAVILLAASMYIVFNISNIDKIVQHAIVKHEENKVEQHDAALEIRRNIKPDIDLMLKNMLSSLNCDRVFVMEMHNGTNNTAGLPFIYGEMTYSVTREGVVSVDEDYTNLNLSRFDFPRYLEQNKLWLGTIDELKEIDDKFATRLSSNGVIYLGIVVIHGYSNELGYLGVTYCNGKEISDINILSQNIITQLSVNSQKLAVILDGNTYQ